MIPRAMLCLVVAKTGGGAREGRVISESRELKVTGGKSPVFPTSTNDADRQYHNRLDNLINHRLPSVQTTFTRESKSSQYDVYMSWYFCEKKQYFLWAELDHGSPMTKSMTKSPRYLMQQ